MSLLPEFDGTATFDPTGAYRYTLTRCWDAAGPRVLWVMLNPSTADAAVLDPTIRRCLGFAQTWGYGSLEVVNLFALRSTDPAGLRAVADPVGPGNDQAIVDAAQRAERVVAAWGTHGAYQGRAESVARLLGEVWCLGTTKDGHPRHPLYVRGDAELVRWEAAAERPGEGQ